MSTLLQLERLDTTCETQARLKPLSKAVHRDFMNMSTDPYSGRNPSYCFVELGSKSEADQAMRDLSGKPLLGRPVKLGPGIASHKKRKATSPAFRGGHPERPIFKRWTRTDASDHFSGYSRAGRRLWVGGLPRMGTHGEVNAGVRELFSGFEMCVYIPAVWHKH